MIHHLIIFFAGILLNVALCYNKHNVSFIDKCVYFSKIFMRALHLLIE